MPLTTGRLGERRRVGGTRGAIRTEMRRAKRDGNTQLANQLGGALAAENLNRAALGDSNVGSADSDIRQNRATAFLERQMAREKAALASGAAATPTPQPAATDGPSQPQGPATQPSDAQTAAPSTDPVPVGGAGGAAPVTPPAAGGTGAPDSVGGAVDSGINAVRPRVRDTQGPGASTANDFADAKFPGQTPLAAATAASEFRNQRAEALARGEVPNFEGSPEYDRVRAQFGDAEAENFLRDARREYFDEFEAQYGTEALLSTLRGRQAEFNAETKQRDTAKAFERALSDVRVAEQERAETKGTFDRSVQGLRGVVTGAAAKVGDVVGRAAEAGLGAARALTTPTGTALPEAKSVERMVGESPTVAHLRDLASREGMDPDRRGAEYYSGRLNQYTGALRAAVENPASVQGEVDAALSRIRELERTGQSRGTEFRKIRAQAGPSALLLDEATSIRREVEARRRAQARELGARVTGAARAIVQPFSTDAAAAVDRAAARLGNNSRR